MRDGWLQQHAWSAAAQAASPFVALALLCRAAAGARQSGQPTAERLSERFGAYSVQRPAGPLLWVHAVSVGEGVAAAALVAMLRARHPQLSVLVTAGSTAALEARSASPVWDDCHLALAPLDTPRAARAFLRHWQPCAAIFVESELWPNLLEEARCVGLPVALVNARMSAASARRWSYALAAPLARRMLRSLSLICAMNVIEEARLGRLCSDARFGPVGDLKAAAAHSGRWVGAPSALTDALLACRRAGRFVWVAASTHAGEEAAAGAAHALLRAAGGRSPLALVVPRHPERAAAVALELARAHPSMRVALHSRDGARAMQDADAYVVDAFGVLAELYAAADAAFVGNSLLSGGRGHNLAEAAAAGCVVLSGPHLGPFAALAEQLRAAGGATVVGDPADLHAALSQLRNAPDACARRGRAAADAAAALAAGVLHCVADAVAAALALDA
jgi:3-deoxy-D-manno-octulosonic-acid transferase